LWIKDLDNFVEKYDIIEISVLIWIVWWNFLITKIPLPLHVKFILVGVINWFWISYWIWYLKEKWVLDKMIEDETLPKSVRDVLSNLKN
jgi:hypothetical protein